MQRRRWKHIGIAALFVHIALCAFSAYSIFSIDIESYDWMDVSNVSSDFVVLIACSCIYSSTLMDRRVSRNTDIFMILLTLEALLLSFDIQNWIVNDDPELIELNYILNYLIYGTIIILMATFWWYIADLFREERRVIRRRSVMVYTCIIIGLILIAANYWTGIYFSVDEFGSYHRTEDTFYLSLLMPSIISVITLVTITQFEHQLRRKLTFYGYVLIPYGASVVQSFMYGISLQYISFMLALLLMYANIYVSRSNELISSESEMLEHRAEAMVSQIQPHFLYNVLTSIMNIKGSSEESKDAIVDFSRYLRFNLDSTRKTYPIPVTAEIDHVETYINLRRLHYGDKLEFDTDVQDRNFHIPPQSLKVMVQSLLETGIDDTDFMMITLATESMSRDHVVRIGYGGPDPKMEQYLESDSFKSLEPTLDRLKRSVGGRFEYKYVADDYAEIILYIPMDRKVVR